jgi:hypothetical protein
MAGTIVVTIVPHWRTLTESVKMSALMQPYIMGCGPWRSCFTDHLTRPASH